MKEGATRGLESDAVIRKLGRGGRRTDLIFSFSPRFMLQSELFSLRLSVDREMPRALAVCV